MTRVYSSILVALDGSPSSKLAGEIAIALARATPTKILACHVYDAGLHSSRFRDMEPGLAARYRDEAVLRDLRLSHGSLISDGLRVLSRGYMEDFLAAAGRSGTEVTEASAEGRNYVKILQTAREKGVELILVGAAGLNDVQDGQLGSTAMRVVRHAPCDVLVARRPLAATTILAGIDGSHAAVEAARKAALWSRKLGGALHLVASYDPYLHLSVFRTISHSMSVERQTEAGLFKQEALHEEIIDKGLCELYRGFLKRAEKAVQGLGAEPVCNVVRGKAYRALIEQVREQPADLLVVGRHGHHQEALSQIGSNAEAVARLAPTNVLVVELETGAQGPAQPAPGGKGV